MRHGERRSFPVGLYAGLLLASVALVRPSTFAPLDVWAGAVQSLPLRALPPAWFAADEADRAGGRARDERRAWRSIAAHEEAQDRATLAMAAAGSRQGGEGTAAWRDGFEAVSRRVVAILTSRSGRPWGLELERGSIDGDPGGVPFAGFVTVGDVLVGFLSRQVPPGRGPVVRLLQARGVDGRRDASVAPLRVGAVPLERPVVAEADVRTADGEPARWRFVVEPAARIEDWPLRCTLLENPYRTARGFEGEPVVRTAEVEQDPLGYVPAGLRIGTLRAWGYPGEDGQFLPIGLYVEPARRARAVARVALWRPRLGPAGPPAAEASMSGAELARSVLAGGALERARLLPFPVPRPLGERWLALAPLERREGAWSTPFPSGAAVLDGPRLVGHVARSGPGHAVVAPFGEPGEVWTVSLWTPSRSEPLALEVRVVARSPGVVLCSRTASSAGGEAPPSGPGELFTSVGGPVGNGVGGRHLPAGLWIGPCTVRGDGLLEVERAPRPVRPRVFRRLGPGETAG